MRINGLANDLLDRRLKREDCLPALLLNFPMYHRDSLCYHESGSLHGTPQHSLLRMQKTLSSSNIRKSTRISSTIKNRQRWERIKYNCFAVHDVIGAEQRIDIELSSGEMTTTLPLRELALMVLLEDPVGIAYILGTIEPSKTVMKEIANDPVNVYDDLLNSGLPYFPAGRDVKHDTLYRSRGKTC